MIELPGIELRSLPLAGLTKVRDLDYFDGPLLSHFVHRRGDHYLHYWCDCDASFNRWLVLRVSETNIIRLVNGFVPLDYVIPNECQDEFVYVLDIDSLGKVSRTQLLLTEQIPQEYKPGPAYLPASVDKNERSYPILLENGLSQDNLRELPTKYSQAYAFLYVLNVLRPVQFPGYPWRGGFSSMHFYNAITGLVPGEQRSVVTAIQFTSPGFIKFTLHRPTASIVAQCVEKFTLEHSPSYSAFQHLNAYFREHKLRDLRESIHDESAPEWREHNAELKLRTHRLFSEMDIGGLDTLLSAAPSPFEAARIAYSFGMRISSIAHLVGQGLIKLPMADWRV